MKTILLPCLCLLHAFTAVVGEPPVPSSQYLPPGGNYLPPSGSSGQTAAIFGSRPSSSYGTPSAPSQNYGTPSQSYGTPSAPSQQYGAPSQSYSSPSQQYGAPSNQYSGGGAQGGYGSGGYGNENNAPANYEFEYAVQDGQSGNDFGHKESRQGSVTVGRYYVLLPDGRKQVVNYEADENGYRPKITYEQVGNGGYNNGGYSGNGGNNGGYNY